MSKLTSEQAALICDAHEIEQLLDNEEEVDLLKANNPELLEAYMRLIEIAKASEYEDRDE